MTTTRGVTGCALGPCGRAEAAVAGEVVAVCAGRERRAHQLENEARRSVLLRGLDGLEATSQGDDEGVVAPPHELHRLGDSPRQLLLHEGHVEHVPGHAHYDTAFALLHAERHVGAGLEDEPHDLIRRPTT